MSIKDLTLCNFPNIICFVNLCQEIRLSKLSLFEKDSHNTRMISHDILNRIIAFSIMDYTLDDNKDNLNIHKILMIAFKKGLQIS